MSFTANDLGRRIRHRRLELGWTLKDVEARSDVSATHISEVERGRTSPTVGVLARLAEALGTRPSHLVDFPDADDVVVRKSGNRMIISDPALSVYCEVVVGEHSRADFSVFLITLPPGHPEGFPGAARAGDKLWHVMEGSVEVRMGESAWNLGPGDSLHLRATRPQTVSNRSNSTARLLWADWPRFNL